jgi:hypothetical protein
MYFTCNGADTVFETPICFSGENFPGLQSQKQGGARAWSLKAPPSVKKERHLSPGVSGLDRSFELEV